MKNNLHYLVFSFLPNQQSRGGRGVMAEWIRPWVCDLRIAGSSLVAVIAVVSLGKTLYLDCFSLPRCINGNLVGDLYL